MSNTVIFLDVDGTLSPLAFEPDGTGWRKISPNVWAREEVIKRLGAIIANGTEVVWLTSWESAANLLIPKLGWPELEVLFRDRSVNTQEHWWKRIAAERWLDDHPYIERVVWLDDDLAKSRGWTTYSMTIDMRLRQRGIDALLIAPKATVGLTSTDLIDVEAFCAN